MEREQRKIVNRIKRSDEETRLVEGVAVVFNQQSNYIGWVETISPEAITEEVIKRSDIFALLNHDEDKVLARSNKGIGSLVLELKEDGLHYLFEAPNTQFGDELLEHLKRGEINTSSFAFCVADEPDAQTWSKKDGVIYRTINKIGELFDVSPVYRPAYSQTNCSKRGQEMVEKSEKIDAEMSTMMDEIDKLINDEE